MIKVNINGVEMSFSGASNDVSIVNGKVLINGQEADSSQFQEDNSPKTVKKIEFDSITGIDSNVVFTVEIDNSEKYAGNNAIFIEGTEKQIQKVHIKEGSKSGELKVRTDNGSFKDVKLIVNSDNLKRIKNSGTSGIKGSYVGDSLTIDNSGVSSVVLKGMVNKLEVNSSGVGDVDLRDLEAKKVEIDSSGVSKVFVWATEKLSGSKSGVGNVSYWGVKEHKIKVSGLGSIKYGGEKVSKGIKKEEKTEKKASDDFNFFNHSQQYSNDHFDKQNNSKKNDIAVEQNNEEVAVKKPPKYKL